MAQPHPDRNGEDELSLGARVSNEIVRTMKELYGKGPTQAKTYFCDEHVICILKDGLTRNEETLVRAGEEEIVREFRLRFQRVIAPELERKIELILGRKVLTYHSQALFNPSRLIEIFVLDDDGSAP